MLFRSNLPRRAFLRNLSAVAVSSYLPLVVDAQQDTSQGERVGPQLDTFIREYMKAMNAPGLTLALVHKNGNVQTAGFGYADLELRSPVTADLLFEIGSITKSFVALTLLQLRDEGKLDLKRPILEYLPWVPIEESYGVITPHHLLTHSSGLPDALGLFLTDPAGRHRQAFAPGEHFHYCNVGFTILGYLIQTLDQRPWPEAVRSRIFEPLGMNSTRAVISDRTRAQRPQSYVPFYTGRPYPRHGRLAPAGELVFEDGAGSITSTPGDMGLYLHMLLNRGQGGRKRIVSEESFTLFTTPYIKAPEFSATAFYGYGISVDKLDGHTILRHTGGMVSFASSIHVDLDGGVAAFASINAMQGYRPVPVTQFAVQTMNAEAQNKTAPAAPELPSDAIKNAQDYAGTYTASNGKRIDVSAEGDKLLLRAGSASIPLERMGGDAFVANAPGWDRFPVVFGRAETDKGSEKRSPVVELAYGSEWYTNDRYAGPRSYPELPEYQRFIGSYQADSAWVGSAHVVLRKGKLWADGVIPLEPIGNALFRFGGEPYTPDTAEFFYFVDGKAQMLKVNGADMWRIEAD